MDYTVNSEDCNGSHLIARKWSWERERDGQLVKYNGQQARQVGKVVKVTMVYLD